jgi:hypothetical protein
MKTKNKQSSASNSNGSKQPAKSLSKKDQKSTNGGGLLGGDDNSSLSSSLGVNLKSSHTDEDGQTESNNFGGNIGSNTQSMND